MEQRQEENQEYKDLMAADTKAKEAIETLSDEISALEKGIKELDASVIAATEQRQEENQEYKDLMAADTKANEVLKFAKERLNQFYNPKLALTQADRVGSSVLVEVGVHEVGKAAPGPPPETWDAYAKKS